VPGLAPEFTPMIVVIRLCRWDTFCGVRTKSENLTEEVIDNIHSKMCACARAHKP